MFAASPQTPGPERAPSGPEGPSGLEGGTGALNYGGYTPSQCIKHHNGAIQFSRQGGGLVKLLLEAMPLNKYEPQRMAWGPKFLSILLSWHDFAEHFVKFLRG